MASQQQVSNTPMEIRDSLETPGWLFWWADQLFNFDFDLAASDSNKKCDSCFTNHALQEQWIFLDLDSYAWCNPPYSQPGKWLTKAWQEAQDGFRSVFLVPTPNGDQYWQESVFGKASEIIFINGRVSFISPADFIVKGKKGAPDKHIKKGDELKGNTRGSCLVVYNRRYEGQTALSWMDRDEAIRDYNLNKGK